MAPKRKKEWVEIFDLENPNNSDLEDLAMGENGETPIYILRHSVWIIASNYPITDKTIDNLKL